MKTPQIAPLDGMTPLGFKPQTEQEKFMARIKACKNSKAVAVVYADMIDATTLDNANKHSLNIPALNAFILLEYSVSTFKAIKNAAWKICDKRRIDEGRG